MIRDKGGGHSIAMNVATNSAFQHEITNHQVVTFAHSAVRYCFRPNLGRTHDWK